MAVIEFKTYCRLQSAVYTEILIGPKITVLNGSSELNIWVTVGRCYTLVTVIALYKRANPLLHILHHICNS